MNVFITGITGTIGTALAEHHAAKGDKVFGCARNEARCVLWGDKHSGVPVMIADAGDAAEWYSRVGGLFRESRVDRVYHCAAMKHVDLCEQNPGEAVRQNVELTIKVAAACNRAGVPLVFVSTDKACAPCGVYGATKLAAERVVLQAGGAVCRLGNVVGSSGSVFARWKLAAAEGKPVIITDPLMTRYFMDVQHAVAFLANCATPGRVRVPGNLSAAQMGELAKAFADKYKCEIQAIGRRPGETLHQWLVSMDEAELGSVYLGDYPCMDPLHSSTAYRWRPERLLEAAGV